VLIGLLLWILVHCVCVRTKMTRRRPKWDCTEWLLHSEAQLSGVTDRQTDRQTQRTSVTIVCISCIRCSLVIQEYRTVTYIGARRLPKISWHPKLRQEPLWVRSPPPGTVSISLPMSKKHSHASTLNYYWHVLIIVWHSRDCVITSW